MKPSEYLEKHEWIKERFEEQNEEGQCTGVCLVGAIQLACKEDKTNNANNLTHNLHLLCHRKFRHSAFYVNDIILQSKEEAIALLKEVEESYMP